MTNNVSEILNSIAVTFGFRDAAQAFSTLSSMYLHRTDGAYYKAAVKIVYRHGPDDIQILSLFVSDLTLESGDLSFYTLTPQPGAAYLEHFEKMLEIGTSIKTPEELFSYINDPSKFGFPVQREFFNSMVHSVAMSGVVNYIRDDTSEVVSIITPESFTPVLEKPDIKQQKDEKGSMSVVTPLTPRPKK